MSINIEIAIKRFILRKSREITWDMIIQAVEAIENLRGEDIGCDYRELSQCDFDYNDFELDNEAQPYFQWHNFGIYIEVKNIYRFNANQVYEKFEVPDVRGVRRDRKKDSIEVIRMFLRWYIERTQSGKSPIEK